MSETYFECESCGKAGWQGGGMALMWLERESRPRLYAHGPWTCKGCGAVADERMTARLTLLSTENLAEMSSQLARQA